MEKRNLFIAGLIVVLAIAGLIIFKMSAPTASTLSQDEPLDGEIEVKGYIECLPLKIGEQLSDRYCVKGIVGSDGKYYALDSSRVSRKERLMDEGQPVRAVGVFQPVNENSEESKVFEYSGVLVVRILE